MLFLLNLHQNNYMKRTSIKDIAHAVGVSTATISLVLSGKAKEGRVSKEMVDKITRVAKEMNYQPNRLARNLQSGRTQTIGLLVADIMNPFFSALAYYIQKEMSKSGYTVVIMNTDESSEQMEKMMNLMVGHQVDGFIIVPAEHGENSIMQLLENKVPLVLVDRYYPQIATNNVLLDNVDASFQATRYLIEKQCKNIGLIIYDNKLPHMAGRKSGYIQALEQAGMLNENLIREVEHTTMSETVEKAIESLLAEKPQIDGLVLASNTIALNGLKQMNKSQIRIPEDISVVCFDKSDVFEFMPHPMPYIQQPIQDMANMASRLLLNQLEDKNSEGVSTYKLPAELIF